MAVLFVPVDADIQYAPTPTLLLPEPLFVRHVFPIDTEYGPQFAFVPKHVVANGDVRGHTSPTFHRY